MKVKLYYLIFYYSLNQLTKELQQSAVVDQERVRLLDVGDVCLAKPCGEEE